MPNVLNLLHEFGEAANDAAANTVDFNRLNQHEMNEIFAPVTSSRYNVCQFGIDAAARAIGASYADIPAISAAELQAASVTVNPLSPSTGDSSESILHMTNTVETPDDVDSYLAYGDLAHAAYQAQSDDQANARRVQHAWNNYDQAGPRKIIDPVDIPTSETEAVSSVEQDQYLTVISDGSEPPPADQETITATATEYNQAGHVAEASAAVAQFWAAQPQKPQPVYRMQHPQQVPLHSVNDPYANSYEERTAA